MVIYYYRRLLCWLLLPLITSYYRVLSRFLLYVANMWLLSRLQSICYELWRRRCSSRLRWRLWPWLPMDGKIINSLTFSTASWCRRLDSCLTRFPGIKMGKAEGREMFWWLFLVYQSSSPLIPLGYRLISDFIDIFYFLFSFCPSIPMVDRKVFLRTLAYWILSDILGARRCGWSQCWYLASDQKTVKSVQNSAGPTRR